jgi:dienelactone hydrolase
MISALLFASTLIAAQDSAPPDYPDHTDLSNVRDPEPRPIKAVADWEIRRRHIVKHMERVMGPMPGPERRAALDVKVIEEKRVSHFSPLPAGGEGLGVRGQRHVQGSLPAWAISEISLQPLGLPPQPRPLSSGGERGKKLIRKKITYQSDPDDRVPAYLFVPSERPAKKLPAILCLHQTTNVGKDEPAGLRGDAEMRYGLELAERGYIVIIPDYPSLGEHVFDFKAKTAYASGSMKAIWDNRRAIDVLETLEDVDKDRIGVIGHSLGGHDGMFTAVFEPRIKVIVSSCGFTTFRKDDMPSWTGPRYMPRIATQFKSDAKLVPFDFQEIVAAFAPRPFLACAAEKDDDFDVSGVRDVMKAARAIYALHGAEDRLAAHYPPGKHAFPAEARKTAYEFLDRHLKPSAK